MSHRSSSLLSPRERVDIILEERARAEEERRLAEWERHLEKGRIIAEQRPEGERPAIHLPAVGLGDLVARVGSFGSLKVELGPEKGFKVILKLNHPSLGPVYRMGYLSDLNGVLPLVQLWVEAGYWTKDQYPLREYQEP